jgi:hypothetical protein
MNMGSRQDFICVATSVLKSVAALQSTTVEVLKSLGIEDFEDTEIEHEVETEVQEAAKDVTPKRRGRKKKEPVKLQPQIEEDFLDDFSDEESEEEVALTLADVSAKVREFIQKFSDARVAKLNVKKVLTKFDAKTLSDLPAENYQEFVEILAKKK